ncbi:hypothetical protein H8D83_01885 [Candidatus Woesearchaeota archaeon]|nr:hypothetical protein [Candidatus Woesearchaeota archaeon]MBL7050583.1 hypothetical protein [Candidatus Woesearchaeota archaeon]
MGVYSNVKTDIKKQELIGKKRKSEPVSLIIDKKYNDFHYLVITEEYGKLFKQKACLIAYAELIKSFSDLEKIIIDGDLREPLQEELKQILYPNKYGILAVAKADMNYKVVNMADQIANLIHRDYKRPTRLKKYLPHLITPKIEDYLSLLE